MSTIARPEINPLWLVGLRSRCRPRHLASWGVIWLTVSAFVFLMIYLTLTERQGVEKVDASKTALLGIFIIQAIILMFFGTGSIASGVAQERDEGLLDYVRMTPMSPTAKILGYLFGLPSREYVLVGLTMPFVAVIVLLSGFSLLTLAHFYLVFFSSVLVYHMTGLAAGMVSRKPRFASMLSMGLVVSLYFLLPNLSRIGITFFEFLTIRPTLFGLVQQELPEHLRMQAERSGIDAFRPVPFFETTLRPTVYTLLVQGFLIATMFSVVHRRWRDQSSHLFSKAGALVVFSGVALFTTASVWSVIAQDDAYRALFGQIRSWQPGRVPGTLTGLLFVALLILGGVYLVLVRSITPTRDTALAGLRRARKLSRRVGINDDASSSLPVALVMLAITLGVGWMLVALAARGGDYFAAPPSAGVSALLILGVASVALFIQGVASITSMRVFGVVLFTLWMIPFFTMMIVVGAFEAEIPGIYIGQPCPPISLGFGIGWMLETTAPFTGQESGRFLPEHVHPDAPGIMTTGMVGYAIAAAVVQTLRVRFKRSLFASA